MIARESGDSRSPRISVVMPVHNVATYLPAALTCIRRQTFADFECVVVDDGSTDDSRQCLQRCAEEDPRFRLVSIVRSGIVTALNRGLEIARGELIARMDGDDLCHPDRLRRQVEYLDSHPDCVAVSSRVLLVDPDGRPIWRTPRHDRHTTIERALLEGNGAAFVHAAALMRAQAIRNINGYRKQCEFAEDLDLFLRLAEVGRLHVVADTLYFWRQHLASVGHARVTEQFHATCRAVQEGRSRRGISDDRFAPLQMPAVRTVDEREAAWARMAAVGAFPTTMTKYLHRVMKRRPFSASTWFLSLLCVLSVIKNAGTQAIFPSFPRDVSWAETWALLRESP